MESGERIKTGQDPDRPRESYLSKPKKNGNVRTGYPDSLWTWNSLGTCSKGPEAISTRYYRAVQIGGVQHNASNTLDILYCRQPHWNLN